MSINQRVESTIQQAGSGRQHTDMSVRDRTDINIDNDAPKTRWTDDTSSEHADDSISSEEEADCESEGDPQCRTRPVQEIWDAVSVWTGLQMLPDADELLEMIKCGDTEDILSNENALRTGLLLAVWINNRDVLKYLLENGADPLTPDENGRSAVHLAAFQGHPDCLQLLANAGANVNIWDRGRKATPLHCAASRGCVTSVRTLLKAGADVNAGLTMRSALHYAVQSNATDCVNELLEAGASPNTPQVFTETPLHVAAAMGFMECINLLIKHGADVRVQCGLEKTTALHMVAEDGNTECAKLLLDAGANVNGTNKKLQTPLHLASLAQSAETLELLLKRGADPDAGDIDGRTPLHSAIVKVTRSTECVRLLLHADANVNKADIFGYTPLHIAALNEFSQCVLMLINYGGDLTAKTNGGISALNFIIRRTPDVMPKYLSKLDSAIKLTDHEIGDVDCELKLDFRILVPSVGRGETELLLNFIQVGRRDILKHPLCETFLFLKWKRIRKFFLLSLLYHTLFVILFTAYVLGVYLKDCHNVEQDCLFSAADKCVVAGHIRVLGYVLLIINCWFLMKELFQIAHNWKDYIKHWDNWLQWMIILSVFLCVVPGKNIKSEVATWQHHVAAIGIFLAWVELMMIVGRFPMFGLYVQMFTTVAINFSKFLLAYSCLLIAFGLSFGVLFANYKSFKNLFVGLLKTIIMMSGELEFEDIFYDDEQKIFYPGTAHVFFLAFVLLVTVILTNLMVGLAVSDIQGLQQSAGLDHLVRQAKLVAHLESMLFSQLLHYDYCILKKLLAFFYRSALLLTSNYHWAIYIRPNDPRELKIPKELIQNVYQLVAARKEKPKYRGRKFGKTSSQKTTNGKTTSSLSINKSETGFRIYTRMHSNSNSVENLTNLKSQVANLSDQLGEYNMIIQQKLNQLTLNINSIKK